MQRFFYLFPILVFVVFAVMALNYNSNHRTNYQDNKEYKIQHNALKDIEKSNFLNLII